MKNLQMKVLMLLYQVQNLILDVLIFWKELSKMLKVYLCLWDMML